MQRFFGPTAIDSTMAAGQVALAVLRKHFAAMLANEEGTMEGSDPEKLHDMRVATRRMRAAFGVFAKWLPSPFASFEKELKWIGGALGEVRDLDVQIQHQRDWAGLLGNESDIEPWFAMLTANRESNRNGLISALQSERYAQFVGEFGEALLHPSPAKNEPNILSVAPALIKKRWKKLKSAIDALDGSSPDQDLHNARILAKRLRYSIEFVAPVYGPAAKETSTAIAGLQDVLGLHQDCTVTKQIVKERLVKGWKKLPPTTCFELGRLVCHADAIKFEQRALVCPTFDAIRQGPWTVLKELLVAPPTSKGPDSV